MFNIINIDFDSQKIIVTVRHRKTCSIFCPTTTVSCTSSGKDFTKTKSLSTIARKFCNMGNNRILNFVIFKEEMSHDNVLAMSKLITLMKVRYSISLWEAACKKMLTAQVR